jgi:hypothetical protein
MEESVGSSQGDEVRSYKIVTPVEQVHSNASAQVKEGERIKAEEKEKPSFGDSQRE